MALDVLSPDTEAVISYLEGKADLLDEFSPTEEHVELFVLLLKRPSSDNKDGIDRDIMNIVRRAESKKEALIR